MTRSKWLACLSLLPVQWLQGRFCRSRAAEEEQGCVVAGAALPPQLLQLLPLACARVAQALCWGDAGLADAPGRNSGFQEVLPDAFGDSNPVAFFSPGACELPAKQLSRVVTAGILARS